MSTDGSLIEKTLLAASLSDPEISARVAGIGPDNVAQALLSEVASRAALLTTRQPDGRFVIQCDFGFDGERLGYLLTLDGGVLGVEKRWDKSADATIRQDLVDLLQELFGPVGPRGATREVFAKEYENSEYSTSVAAAMWPVLGAMSQRPKDLSELAARFGSDKWGGRWYTPHYQKHFEPYRDLPSRSA